MILTYKIKHGKDFSVELEKARKVAEFALSNKGSATSSAVAHIGLKSAIANQILRKYARNRKLKRIRSVKLTVPGQSIRADKIARTLTVPCLGIHNLPFYFDPGFAKIAQIECDNLYCFVAVEYPDTPAINPTGKLGIDLNTTGHCIVVADPDTGKVLKAGKQTLHIRQKYKAIRRQLQKEGKFTALKLLNSKESRVIRDINHKLSKHVVDIAAASNKGLQMEDLTNLRTRTKKKTNRTFRYALNSWPYYQLRTMIDYKAKKLGIPVTVIDPAYTSQTCSRCGLLGTRIGKTFKCSCGHVDHADANAAFNIGVWIARVIDPAQTEMRRKGDTDTPAGATALNVSTPEPHGF